MSSSRFLDEMKSKINLSDVISKKVSLKSRGKDYVGLCPFHNEKTPSFTVNDLRGFYHCFGCNAHGDIFTFIMESEGLTFMEAVRKLAGDYGIDLPEFKKSKKSTKEKKEIYSLYEINEVVCKFFEENLSKSYGKAGLLYAKQRGLNKADLKKFRIGFALNSFDSLIKFLKEKSYSEEDMLKAGVIARSNKGAYDKFRNRLMFPVIDKRGRVIAFTGRVIDDAMPKYMNSPETKIYHKGNVLFNFYFARKAIYDEKYAILVEGNLDALSLYINKIENVVAPMGTAITENQLLDLWKSTNQIVVCLDGDTAGKRASKRISELVLPLINTKRNIKFGFLPNKKDPDDFVRERGKREFINKIVKKALPLSEFIWFSEMEKLGIDDLSDASPELKARLEHNLFVVVNKIKDSFSQRHFRDFYKKKLWSDGKKGRVKNVKTKLKPLLHNVVDNHTVEKIKEVVERCECRACVLLAKYPQLLHKLYEKYSVDINSLNFSKKEAILFLDILGKFSIKNESFNEINFKKELEKNDLSDYLKYNGFADFFDVLDEERILCRVYRILVERDVALMEMELKIEAGEGGDIEKINLLQAQLIKLKKKRLLLDNEFDFI